MTVRLVHAAVSNWDTLDGYAAAHGMPDLLELTLDRFCNFTWYMLTRYSEQKDIDQLKAKIWVPPPHATVPIPASSPWSAENETSAFAAVKAMVKG